jgi:hypothetical protein
MSKFSRIVVLATALASLFAVMSSTAGAVTWTNTGGTTFHATGGPGTLSIGVNNLACGGSTATGVAPMSSATSTVATGTVVFSPCVLIPGQSMFVHCTYTLTANAFSAGVTAGTADVTCDTRLAAAPANSLCHISGSTGGTYTNPAGGAAGKLTLHASTSLVVSNGNVACPLGTGNGSLTEQTITVTSVAESPILARDA